MTRKISCLALALLFCVSIAPITPASALTWGDYEYTILGNQVTITKYIGAGGDVVIPSTINGIPVTKIGTRAFAVGASITTVVIPSTVTEIGSFAFGGCIGLTSVTIPNSVTKIGMSAFQSCKSLVSCLLPESLILTGFDSGLFMDCKRLENISLPKGLEIIPTAMWAGCTSLTNITIPEGITKIGTRAFAECTSLVSVIFPSTLKEIGDDAFSGCTSLRSAPLNSGLEVIGTYAFENAILDAIVLPASIKRIGAYAFYNAHSQSAIIVPYGATHVGFAAFASKSLVALYLPSSISALTTYTNNRAGIFVKHSSFYPNTIVYCPSGSYVAKECEWQEISYIIDDSIDSRVQVMYNDRRVSFAEYGQNPVNVNGRLLVPMRAVSEMMGGTVDYEPSTQTITGKRGDITFTLKIGSNTMDRSGVSITLDVPPQIMNGRALVPLRAIAECFDADVSWNAAGSIAIIRE